MIHFFIGTRAQLIKTAPVMAECMVRGVPYRFIFLAQHHQTISEMIRMFGIKQPDVVVGDLGQEISTVYKMLKWLLLTFCNGSKDSSAIFGQEKRGLVVVHGDALPALIGAFLAKCVGLKVAHIEAGLRSFHFLHPFPEELIRVLIWQLRLVDYYFCPNEWALKNVEKYPGRKFNTLYNTLYDSLQMALQRKDFDDKVLNIPNEKYALVSVHRYETLSRRETMVKVVDILDSIAKRLKLIFVLHPPTAEALTRYKLQDKLMRIPNIEVRQRYGYFDFIRLLSRSEFLVTDGGSNQEECFYLGHPCLLLRHKTERKEGLGRNVIISRFDSQIIESFLNDYRRFGCRQMFGLHSPSKMIVDHLLAFSL